MIVDGFDYGDGWTLAGPGYERDNSVQFYNIVDRKWENRWASKAYLQALSDVQSRYSENGIYRRPMTEAEMQAEKAKEEKVGSKVIGNHVGLFPNEYEMVGNRVIIPLKVVAEKSQLPEVMAEVERQRKARTVDRRDWFWYHGTIRRCAGVSTSDPQLTDNQGSILCVSECHKITDLVFIALLENGAK